MDSIGFIREKMDIKILILYVLEKLPMPVEPLVLSDMVMVDAGFTWFDYTECLTALIESGHIVEEDGRYIITEKGRQNVLAVSSTLPYTVRERAEKAVAPVAAAMFRSSMIDTATEPSESGGYAVSMRLADSMGEIISMRLAVPDEEEARYMEESYRNHAEEIYNQILDIFLKMNEG